MEKKNIWRVAEIFLKIKRYQTTNLRFSKNPKQDKDFPKDPKNNKTKINHAHTPRYIIVKWLDTKDKGKILKVARGIKTLHTEKQR